MSTPTYIQSNQIPVAISTDNITYKNVVCKRVLNLNTTNTVNTEETDCGVAKGLGAFDWTADFEGAVNTTPNGATEMSAKEMLNLAQNQTLVYIKWITGDGAGNNLYRQGSGYIADYTETYNIGNVAAFTFTLTGVGAIDTTV